MSPSTSARFADAANGFALVICREFATTLYPRFTNASTSPAPIPCEAPVTIAVFRVSILSKLLYYSVERIEPALGTRSYANGVLVIEPLVQCLHLIHCERRIDVINAYIRR